MALTSLKVGRRRHYSRYLILTSHFGGRQNHPGGLGVRLFDEDDGRIDFLAVETPGVDASERGEAGMLGMDGVGGAVGPDESDGDILIVGAVEFPEFQKVLVVFPTHLSKTQAEEIGRIGFGLRNEDFDRINLSFIDG